VDPSEYLVIQVFKAKGGKEVMNPEFSALVPLKPEVSSSHEDRFQIQANSFNPSKRRRIL
jgi:hypothetical protein